MHKYDKIRGIDHRYNEGILDDGSIVVTEKMDGANFRFKLDRDSDKILFGTRRTQLKEDNIPKDPDAIGGQFNAAAEYVAERVDADDIRAIEEKLGTPVVFYGENMKKHTLDYDWDETPQFLAADIWLEEEGKYLPTKKALQLFSELGLEFVPIVEWLEDPSEFEPEVPESEYRDGLAEGIVIRNEETGDRAKVVSEDFREKHDSGGSGDDSDSDKPTPQDHGEDLAEACATDARIRKIAQKMRDSEDDTYKDDFAIEDYMPDLYERVAADIVEEEAVELATSNKSIDFHAFRSEVGKRCAQWLQRPDEV